jgi:hypothetical protein
MAPRGFRLFAGFHPAPIEPWPATTADPCNNVAQGQSVDGIGIDDAADAGDQALQGGFVDPIGAAEAVHHPHLGTLGGGVPDILGEGVVGDGGAVAVSPLGDAQIHT